MKLTDLVTDLDGRMSLTKLAASTAHLSMAVGFLWVTYRNGYVAELWITYGSFAIGHAYADKATMLAANLKKKKMETASGQGAT